MYFPPNPIGVDLDFSKSMKSSRSHPFCITVLFSNGGLMAELGGWEGWVVRKTLLWKALLTVFVKINTLYRGI